MGENACQRNWFDMRDTTFLRDLHAHETLNWANAQGRCNVNLTVGFRCCQGSGWGLSGPVAMRSRRQWCLDNAGTER
jgi:hypothetical protein